MKKTPQYVGFKDEKKRGRNSSDLKVFNRRNMIKNRGKVFFYENKYLCNSLRKESPQQTANECTNKCDEVTQSPAMILKNNLCNNIQTVTNLLIHWWVFYCLIPCITVSLRNAANCSETIGWVATGSLKMQNFAIYRNFSCLIYGKIVYL